MNEPIKLFAIVAQMEKPGHWNLVGFFDAKLGHMAAINTKRSIIEQMFKLVSPEVKKKGAKIVTLQEMQT